MCTKSARLNKLWNFDTKLKQTSTYFNGFYRKKMLNFDLLFDFRM